MDTAIVAVIIGAIISAGAQQPFLLPRSPVLRLEETVSLTNAPGESAQVKSPGTLFWGQGRRG
jgi:hypothetical protein